VNHYPHGRTAAGVSGACDSQPGPARPFAVIRSPADRELASRRLSCYPADCARHTATHLPDTALQSAAGPRATSVQPGTDSEAGR